MSYRLNKIEELIQAASSIEREPDHSLWKRRASQFVTKAFGTEEGRIFERLSFSLGGWVDTMGAQIGFLEGLAALEDSTAPKSSDASAQNHTATNVQPQSKRVFVVHGSDSDAKATVARLLERLGLEPVILHEQPNSGLTIIEKFEAWADVAFAVVLLTPDDIGGKAVEQPTLLPRARQNVILELGYFMGALSRSRVCALYKQGVEVPSDYSGVAYVEFDSSGGWRTKLAHELVEAGFKIQYDALLKA